MKNYQEYINLKVDLINAVLIGLPRNILDISFDYNNESVILQFILLSNTSLDESFFDRIIDKLKDYKVEKNIIYISREKFNENIGGWIPSGFTWLKYNLYSKAEIL